MGTTITIVVFCLLLIFAWKLMAALGNILVVLLGVAIVIAIVAGVIYAVHWITGFGWILSAVVGLTAMVVYNRLAN